MRALIASTILAATIAIACAGCGGSGRGAIAATTPVPVKGKVTYKGKPVTKGQVVFRSADGGKDAFGDIQPDGSFELSTDKAGDGAAKGTYKVSVTGAGRNVRTKKAAEIDVVEGTTDYTINLQ